MSSSESEGTRSITTPGSLPGEDRPDGRSLPSSTKASTPSTGRFEASVFVILKEYVTRSLRHGYKMQNIIRKSANIEQSVRNCHYKFKS